MVNGKTKAVTKKWLLVFALAIMSINGLSGMMSFVVPNFVRINVFGLSLLSLASIIGAISIFWVLNHEVD